MTFPTEQITSNALNVTSMFNSVQGYSGTIDNVKILPQHIVNDALEDHMRNEKNNGGISLKLVKDCNNGIVRELDETSFKKSAVEMVRDLMSLYQAEENISAIIDTGAFFKNFKNRLIAEAILIVFESRFKAVLYYDEDSNQLEFLRLNGGYYSRGVLETTDPDDIEKSTQVEINMRFTFYDQKKAHAIMTAGPRVLLRDILQGTLRMRQFMTSQRVHLVTTAASRSFYSSKIKKEKTEMTVSDLLTLGALNEDDKQEHENQKLAFGKINSEIRAFVLDEISRNLIKNYEISQKFVVSMITATKPLFMRSIREFPRDWLQESKEENALNIFKTYAVSRLNPLNKIMKTLPSSSEIQKRFNSMKRRIKYMISESNRNLYYAKETIHTPIKLDSGTEVQQQTLTLVDLNMDQLIDNMYSPDSEFKHTYDLLQIMINYEGEEALSPSSAYLSLEDLYKEPKMNASHKPLLQNILMSSGGRVGITQDLIKLIQPETKESNPYRIFSKYKFEGTHFLVQVCYDYDNNLNLKVLLISSKHASAVLKDLVNVENVNTKSKFWLCDLSGNVTATNDSGKDDNVLDFIPQIQDLIFDLLIFNGSLSQILSNQNLHKIYESKWLKSENFENRAIFLRLRMKVLMEKDRIFEEDDQELDKLKKYSLGVQKVSEILVDGYPKESIDKSYEAQKIEELQISSSQYKESRNFRNQSEANDFNFISEVQLLFGISGYEENSEISEAPSLVQELEEISSNLDLDLDETEIPINLGIKRSIIQVSEWSLVKTDGNEQKAQIQLEEQGDDLLDTEITVDDSIDDYEEPLLGQIKINEIKEIIL
jgi:hypothetical protein